jgi:type IV pilus assembly protein PilA
MNEHDRFRFFVRPRARAGAALPLERSVEPESSAAPAPAPLPPVRASADASGTTVSAATWPPARHASRPRRRHLRLVTRLEQQQGDDGFSLLELLVVVAILGILVAAALPRFAEFRAAAYDSRSQQDLRNLAAAEELFRATSPTYADDAALLSGFQPSEGVEVALESADETGFVATATHPAGARDFRWDSSADPPLSSVAR